MIDYTIQYKQQVTTTELAHVSRDWELFLSAYNDTERVRAPYEVVNARVKHWLIQPEYEFDVGELPSGEVFSPGSRHEADFWSGYAAAAGPPPNKGSICVDATGFMRPHLAFLLVWLKSVGVRRVHVIYTDPARYVKGENTSFSEGPVTEVRQIAGFEGLHSIDTTRDLLIIGIGYEHRLIRRVAEAKENARKLQLFGLPSLQPGMYQESVLSANQAAESLGPFAQTETLFAPANDPFVTAQVLHERVSREKTRHGVSNLYLAALGTKPQTLGFALYFVSECTETSTSMLFPYAERYARETAKGVGSTWHYIVELPAN